MACEYPVGTEKEMIGWGTGSLKSKRRTPSGCGVEDGNDMRLIIERRIASVDLRFSNGDHGPEFTYHIGFFLHASYECGLNSRAN